MRVFVTGASGWIGSAVVDELLAAGHEVTGLARSDASAAALEAKGARVRRGDLDDLDGIRAGAEAAEAVIHLANKHDWSNPAASNAAERAAVQTIGDALAGTGRPFLLAAGRRRPGPGQAGHRGRPVAVPRPGLAARRQREPRARVRRPRRARREPALLADRARRRATTGSSPLIAAVAREKGVSGYPGDGTNRWAAVHRSDAARLVALGLEKAPAGARLHAVAEEGVPTREIAEAIGRAFDLPVASIDPDDVAGPLRLDRRASSAWTSRRPAPRPGNSSAGRPPGPTLIEDIDAGRVLAALTVVERGVSGLPRDHSGQDEDGTVTTLADTPTSTGDLRELAARALDRCGADVGALPGRTTLDVRSPITGEVVATVPMADTADVEAAIQVAHEAFLVWRTVPAPVRGALVKRLGAAAHRAPGGPGRPGRRSRSARSAPRRSARSRR